MQLCRIRRPNTLVFHEFLRLPSDSTGGSAKETSSSSSGKPSTTTSSTSSVGVKRKAPGDNTSQSTSSGTSSPLMKPGKREVSDQGDVEVEGTWMLGIYVAAMYEGDVEVAGPSFFF